ncbi:MAG: hypothetical protein CW338_06530 [Clostridiales bacterium]|nr:hypothetical protein [Clostridiales bacterium]
MPPTATGSRRRLTCFLPQQGYSITNGGGGQQPAERIRFPARPAVPGVEKEACFQIERDAPAVLSFHCGRPEAAGEMRTEERKNAAAV